ncbi:MAG TPA: efflux RND transporter periplasmic adaptor subunit [Anaerovoracaceae bacterium]|nr:efflux RND transporter periplasmic adaptor subunit [Anaerovoracaceae bacterium]
MEQKMKKSSIENQSQFTSGEAVRAELNTGGNKGSAKRSKRKIVFIILALIALLIIGFRVFQFFAENNTQEASVINVKVGKVEVGSIIATSPVTGRIEPIEEVSIIPMTSGEVTSVHVKIGDKVSKGTLLFELDKGQIAASYNQAASSYNFAKTSYERMSVLYKEGAVSLMDFEQSKVQYESARASYTLASEAYGNANVRSPIDGFVTSLNISVGSMASLGVPAASIADVSSLVINTNISEYLVGQIKTGDTVEIYISTLGEKTFTGTVTAFSPAPAKGTLTYPVEILVKDDTNVVKAGMFAEVKIVSAERDQILSIPSDSVIVKNGKSLVVLIKNNLPVYREITTGLDNGTSVEVVQGLKKDEVIVTEGQQYITEGIEVNITE